MWEGGLCTQRKSRQDSLVKQDSNFTSRWIAATQKQQFYMLWDVCFSSSALASAGEWNNIFISKWGFYLGTETHYYSAEELMPRQPNIWAVTWAPDPWKKLFFFLSR